jgi:hypothetical protein
VLAVVGDHASVVGVGDCCSAARCAVLSASRAASSRMGGACHAKLRLHAHPMGRGTVATVPVPHTQCRQADCARRGLQTLLPCCKTSP